MLNKFTLLIVLLSVTLFYSCDDARVHDKKEWKQQFDKYQIKDACIIIKDQTHEIVDYYNLNRCRQRFTPASTFKILNSLVALETNTIPDETYTILWDDVKRRAEWDTSMNMRKAFEVSNLFYYQQIAKKIGQVKLQTYLDTCQYGNKKIEGAVDSFWIDGSLTISADEQLGFIKKLYFNQLPFSERTQRIVRSMMLREQTKHSKLSFKTGLGYHDDKEILWVVGYAEYIMNVKEHPNAMNKSNERNYPYFFAMNFDIPKGDTTKDWRSIRIELVKAFIDNYFKKLDK